MKFQLDPPGLIGWLAGFGFVIYTAAGLVSAQPTTALPSGSSTSQSSTGKEVALPLLELSTPGSTGRGACPLQPVYPLPTSSEKLEELLVRLDAVAPLCLGSAQYHAWRGAILLSLSRPAPAIESLERALLIDPDLPGAQLDFASALIGVGDTRSARELMLQLGNRQDLPSVLRQLLDKELALSNPEVLSSRWFLTTAVGIDSNLNNAPSATELTLTFPQGSLTLPLLESSRPRRGLTSLGIVQWQGLRPQGNQLWLFQAELRARQTSDAETRYQQGDISATWFQAQDAPRQWIGRVGTTRVIFGGQQLLESFRASMLHQWQAAGNSASGRTAWTSQCRPSAGIEFENRAYISSRTLDGQYLGVTGSVVCILDTSEALDSTGLQVFSLQARTGIDKAKAVERPGGNFERSELRASWERRYEGFKLNGDYGYSRQTDATGYSPLLADNLRRSIKRQTLRAELSRPFDVWPNIDWFVSAEINVQRSNLEAFNSRQTVFYGGIRWALQ